MSTGGSANPTLTIVALAMRQADHIVAELTRGSLETVGRSRPGTPPLGSPARGGQHLAERSTLALRDRNRAPVLGRAADRGFDLDAHAVQIGQQGAVLLPHRAIRPRLVHQQDGQAVTTRVQLGEPTLDLAAGRL